MSQSFSCKCTERQKPVKQRNWRVLARRQNKSAFNGYKATPSAYSHIVCLTCGCQGRTKADYVYELHDATQAERDILRQGQLPKAEA